RRRHRSLRGTASHAGRQRRGQLPGRALAGARDSRDRAGERRRRELTELDARRYHASYGQVRLWLIDAAIGGGPAYNVPIAVRIGGHLDAAVLQRAMDQLSARHGSLRTRLEAEDGVPVQVVEEDGRFPLERLDIASMAAGACERAGLQAAGAAASLALGLAD